jgi:hypothetical protein
MKRARQKRNVRTCKIIPFPSVIFTIEMVQVVQEALALVSAGLAGLSPSSPNRQFGLETMVTLQEKFHSMLLQERLGYPMPLDQNEIILLHTAMLIFSHHLQHIPSIDRRNAFHLCQKIRELLPPLPFSLPVMQYNYAL